MLFTQLTCFAQLNTKVRGIVLDAKQTIEQATVTNKQTQQYVITNSLGKFGIEVALNDTLYVTHKNYVLKKIAITPEIVQHDLLVIELKPLNIILNEIIIQTSSINALNLGIIQSPVKDYTKSERLLKTAGDFKPTYILGVLGGSLPVDPIINAITGRTKMLKKILEKEGENQLFDRLKETYETFCIEELKISDLETRTMFLMYLSGIENIENLVLTKNTKTNTFNIAQIYKTDFVHGRHQKN